MTPPQKITTDSLRRIVDDAHDQAVRENVLKTVDRLVAEQGSARSGFTIHVIAAALDASSFSNYTDLSKLLVSMEQQKMLRSAHINAEAGTQWWIEFRGDSSTDTNFGQGPLPAHRHVNGGGWVEDSAAVDNDSYVGPFAVVTQNSRVEGPALVCEEAAVTGSSLVRDRVILRGDASVGGMSAVTGNALITDHARIEDNALVQGHVIVSGNATVGGDAEVKGHAHIFENARVDGEATIGGEAAVSDSARVSGHAKVISDAVVAESAYVDGNAILNGSVVVQGHAHATGTAVLSSGIYDGSEVMSGKMILSRPLVVEGVQSVGF